MTKRVEQIKEEDVICWKLYLKKIFINGVISEDELGELYPLNFRVEDAVTKRQVEVITMISDMEHDDANNNGNAMSMLVKNDVNFILDGIINKDSFDKEWIFYLFECFDNKLISEEDYNIYTNLNPLSDENSNIVNDILNKLRVKLVKNHPEMLDCINEPNFDVLMTANQLKA